MPRWRLTVTALVATLALVGTASVASGNEPPMADAGLDQTVANGTTVYLDAGGSVDPDGDVADFRWTITGPDGGSVNTTDPTSARTQFTPSRTGNYTANVSVTDDDGATRTDELYVTVEDPRGPNVTLVGPGEPLQGESTSYTVLTTAGDTDLRELHWVVNGSVEETHNLSENESSVSVNHSFSETGPYRLEATALDSLGYSQTSSLDVEAVSSRGGGGRSSDRCPDGGAPYFGADSDFIGCNDGGADMIFEDRVVEANDRPGLWLHNDDGELVEMATEEEVETMRGGSNAALTREEVEENYEENLKEEKESDFLVNTPDQNQGTGDSSSDEPDNSPSRPSGNSGSTSAPAPPIDTVAPSPSPSPNIRL